MRRIPNQGIPVVKEAQFVMKIKGDIHWVDVAKQAIYDNFINENLSAFIEGFMEFVNISAECKNFKEGSVDIEVKEMT